MSETVPQKSGSKKLWWLLGIAFFVASCGAIYFRFTQYRDVPLKVSEETTLITEPLKANGNIDYLKAFEQKSYSDKIATEDNGFRLIVQNVQWSQKLDQGYVEQLCSKLGLDPKTIQPALTYVEPYDVAEEYFKSPEYDVELIRGLELSQGDLVDKASIEKKNYLDFDVTNVIDSRTKKPWTEKDLPMMAKWVKDQSPVLDLYVKAVKAPIFEMPLIDPADDEPLLYAYTYSGEFRAVARGFVARANYYLGLGDVDRALEDILACKRLGRHLRNRNTMFDRLIGLAVEGTSDTIGVLNITNGSPTKKQLEYFVNELQNLPPLSSMELATLHEKYLLLDAVQIVSKNPELDIFGTDHELQEFKDMGIDWNVAVKEFHYLFNSQLKDESFSLDESRYPSSTTMRWSRESRSRAIGAYFYANTTGVTLKEAERRTQCADHLRLLSLAMLIYEKDHGSLPPAFTADKNGNPLHSWRVHLLPYVGQKELYDQIKMDEPWNSEHNSKMTSKCPEIFQCQSCKECQDTRTSYSVIIGPDTAFGGSQGKKLDSFGAHSDDMILIAERITPISWMDPTQEIPQANAELGINIRSFETKENSQFGSNHPAGVQVGTRNGAFLFLSEAMEADILKAMLQGKNTLFMDH